VQHWKWYSKVALALLVAAFAYWVWPTAWVTWRVGDTWLRVNRLTARVQVLDVDRGGWR